MAKEKRRRSVSPFGMLDIGGGTLANLVATFIAWEIIKRYRFHGSQFATTLIENLVITFIVGLYLQILTHTFPDTSILGFSIPGIVFSWLAIFAGSFVAVNVARHGLLKAIQTRVRR